MSKELWLPIPNSVGYEVSSKGRIRSRRTMAGELTDDPHFIKAHYHSNGSYTIRVSENGCGTTIHMGQLVLTLFGPPKPNPRMVARFIDGNTWNASIENLEWGYQRCVKMTEEDALWIYQLSALPTALSRELAQRFGVHYRTIQDIFNGKTWRKKEK